MRRVVNNKIQRNALIQENYQIMHGDCLSVLKTLPDDCVDCVITSPPYWKQREYDIDKSSKRLEVGREDSYVEYVENLVKIFHEVKRVLKPDGSFWLNIGDKFDNKNLVGLPWRVAIALQDDGWILRSDIIWDQMKGTQSPKDRFRDIYEHVFHFVKNKKYFFDSTEIKIKPSKLPTMGVGGEVQSATGVSGKKYFKYINESNCLTLIEKNNALLALEKTIKEIKEGKIVDFRMTIRGSQRAYHSEDKNISGRAKELKDKGFYILKSKADGFLPSNIWRIVPEDKWRKDTHAAVFPEELLKTPILSTSRKGGIILDPFVGTGSSICAALSLGRKAIGIDLSKKYIAVAKKRILSMED